MQLFEVVCNGSSSSSSLLVAYIARHVFEYAGLCYSSADDRVRGASASSLWHCLCYNKPLPHWQLSTPLDADDFGRCYRLCLQLEQTSPLVMDQFERKVSQKGGPVWSMFAKNWAQLVKSFLSLPAPSSERLELKGELLRLCPAEYTVDCFWYEVQQQQTQQQGRTGTVTSEQFQSLLDSVRAAALPADQ